MSALPPIPASKYLIDDRPLVIKLQLVRLIGFKPAIVLQQVRYWLGEDRRPQVREGLPWVYNTYPDWQKQFPFWPVSTIKGIFLELEREGLLLSGHFNARNTDRTKWYTIPHGVIRDLDRRAQADAAPRDRRRGAPPDDAALPALPESNLLIDRDTLIILPRLAAHIGLNGAIILQQVFYWLGGDRKPYVRDGRRWVYNTYEGWRGQFPFWSERTIRRTIHELENLGLLEAAYFSDHPENRHLDHTKWYTIDFDRLAALESVIPRGYSSSAGRAHAAPLEAAKKRHSVPAAPAAGSGQKVPLGADTSALSKRPKDAIGTGQGAPLEAASDGLSNWTETTDEVSVFDQVERPESATQPAKSRRSSSTETYPEIPTHSTQKQQQVTLGASSEARQTGVVVATIDPGHDLASRLIEHGMTTVVARNLVRDYPAATVVHQVEVFDWLREVDPHDKRYTAGRLRKMIEEDWTSPPGFEPAAVREERAQAAVEAERLAREERAHWVAEHEARRARAEAEWQATLARIGVTDDDQAAWRRLLNTPRRLPPRLAEHLQRAFFYAPRNGNPAVVIMRDEADWEFVCAERHAKDRADVDRRVANHYHRPYVEVTYVHYCMIAALLSGGDDGSTGAVGVDRVRGPDALR
jgi:hypothetical protein